MTERVLPAGGGASLRGRRVLSLVMGHLSSSPRVQKQARALRDAGAIVTVRGNWMDPGLADEDLALAHELDIDFAPMIDLRPRAGRLSDRLRHRLAGEAFVRAGFLSPRVLGPGAWELLRFAAAHDADLVTVHSESGLWVADRLVRAGRCVVVDFEDWFSHDQLPVDRPEPVRAWLRRLETFLLHEAAACLATTEAMASALQEAAPGAPRPTVVRNCFPFPTDVDAGITRSQGPVSFYWYSQTIGPGRGLEVLAEALQLIEGEWTLTLRGALRSNARWFEAVFGEVHRDRIHVEPPVANARLWAATRVHDVGLALEVPYCRNKELTASNKIHEYMRAGVAVIATATAGQEEVMRESAEAGALVPTGDPVALAAAMQAMIDSPERLASSRRAALEAARRAWDWNAYAPHLLSALAGAMEGPR